MKTGIDPEFETSFVERIRTYECSILIVGKNIVINIVLINLSWNIP